MNEWRSIILCWN